MKYKHWINEEDNFLKENYLKMGNIKIGRILNRTPNSIYNQIKKLKLKRLNGLGISMSRKGIGKKNNNLKNNFLIKCGCGKCGQELLKYNKYGYERKYIVGHVNKNKNWKEEEIQFIINNYLKLNNILLGKKLNKTNKQITKKIFEIKLKRPKELVYQLIHSEESNIKKSETRKRLFKERKLIPYWKDKELSEEHCKNISLGKKGKSNLKLKNIPKSEEHCKNISLAKIGIPNPKSSETKKKQFIKGELSGCIGAKGENNHFYGKKSWSNGLTKETDERVRKISIKNKGKIVSEKSRNKISLSNKGISRNKGVIRTQETRNKMSETRKQMFKEGTLKSWNKDKTSEEDPRILGGENHPLFNIWVSREPYGVEFSPELREYIRTRDHHRCQQCFREQDELRTKSNKKYKLMIHHIDFNKRNNQSNNLISLCRNCHAQTNFNRESWIEYFQNKINQNNGELK